MQWPPPYTLRYSNRAQYIKLHIDESRGLVLVLPEGVSERMGRQFIDQKRRWIEKYQHYLTPTATKKQRLVPPTILDLALLQRRWQIHYQWQQEDTHSAKLSQRGDCLYLQVAIQRSEQVIDLLRRWLQRLARVELGLLMQRIAAETGLTYNKLSFRHQKTLWASCSYSKNISLNVKLLFMPEKYVRYVMIHELCHTRHMNHSKRFWRCVSQYEANYLQLDKEINHVKDTIPDWYDDTRDIDLDRLPRSERSEHATQT